MPKSSFYPGTDFDPLDPPPSFPAPDGSGNDSAPSSFFKGSEAFDAIAVLDEDIAAVIAGLDNFDDRYLGAKSSNPTVDNDGDPLLTGALYFNTSANEMRVWTGSSWISASGAVLSVFGRNGVVTAQSGDYTATQVTNTPAGNIAATTVQAALNELDTEKAPLASPALTGTPTAPTAAASTNTTQIATTAFVESEIAGKAVRYDATQGLTSPQQAVALKNIGALGSVLVNGKIVESRAANAVTFAVKGLDGNDPSATNPVIVQFPDASIIAITAALSITVAAGATLGTANATPFRVWIAVANNSGAAVLAVRNSLVRWTSVNAHASVRGFDPRQVTSSTATPGNSAQVTYTPAGITLSSAPYVIAAFADYESGLATAGTWNAAPTRIINWRPGMPLPGDRLNNGMVAGSQTGTAGTVFVASSVNTNVTLSSPCNLVEIEAFTDGGCDPVVNVEWIHIRRATTTQLLNDQIEWNAVGTGSALGAGYCARVADTPFTTAATNYGIYFRGNAAGNSYCPVIGGNLFWQELMG